MKVTESNYLTTREVARLCRVSDATVKRWEDAGLLKSERTSGQHRRFRAEEVARFQREQGLGSKTCHGDKLVTSTFVRRRPRPESDSSLFEFLISGCEEDAANLLIANHLHGSTLTDIFDLLLSPTMRRIGELWYRGELTVAQEHLATRSAHYAVHKLRTSLTVPDMNGKGAVCAAMEGDFHELPPYLAQITLENAGWEVVNFGANLPLYTLCGEIQQFTPKLICISATYATELDRLTRDYGLFRENTSRLKIPIVLGGRVFDDEYVRRRFPADHYADTFRSLADFVADSA